MVWNFYLFLVLYWVGIVFAVYALARFGATSGIWRINSETQFLAAILWPIALIMALFWLIALKPIAIAQEKGETQRALADRRALDARASAEARRAREEHRVPDEQVLLSSRPRKRSFWG